MHIFQYLGRKSYTTRTHLLKGFFNGENDSARILCKQAQLEYALLLQECINNKDITEAKRLHSHIIQTGFNFPDNKLLTMYANYGSLVDARIVFDEMGKRNIVSWNVMIATYARHGFSAEALLLFYKLQSIGIQPDQFSFASVLPACANLASLEQGRLIHGDIIKRGFQFDVFVANALVDMYAKCGSAESAFHVFEKMPQRDLVSWNTIVSGYAQYGFLDQALKLFEKMPQRNVVSWTSMIAGFAKHQYNEEALSMFYKMQGAGIRPNQFTFASVLPACADLATLEQGEEIHEEVIRSGFQSNCFVGNALVDMYAKCGSIEKARYVFDRMLQRDVVSWNVMIAGYAMHGFGRQAIQLFEQMLQFGISPEHATFVGVLSACCHAGLVDEGWRYFYCMSQYYHITPTVEHYGCMVDLIGRAGHLDEAQDFINKMPMEPDAAVWGALLGACRIHTNVEIGEYAAEQLLELNPKSVTPYVLLSVIYAAAGRLAEIEKLRKMVKNRRVKKKPGCSWIIVNKQVNAFLAGDKSHPQTEKINAELEKLAEKMKAAGYAPETTYLLIT